VDPQIPELSSPASETEPVVLALESRLEALEAEKAEAGDRLLRLRAEFDNFRRRTERERSEFVQFASAELARELLPVLDDFERALAAPAADPEYAKGVELIYQRLFEALRKAGLEPVVTAGRRFDPTLHQALERVETEEAEDQTILAEYQKGYNFKGKLLRPAMVKVAVKP